MSKRGSGAGALLPPALAAGRPRRGSAHVAKPPVPPRERRAGGLRRCAVGEGEDLRFALGPGQEGGRVRGW